MNGNALMLVVAVGAVMCAMLTPGPAGACTRRCKHVKHDGLVPCRQGLLPSLNHLRRQTMSAIKYVQQSQL